MESEMVLDTETGRRAFAAKDRVGFTCNSELASTTLADF
jgi:hypothetical protein